MFSSHALHALVHAYGYGAVGVLIGLESMGLPLPGESVLLGAAIYAATTHRLEIWLIVWVAVLGAVLGNTVGYLVGRAVGYRLLRRYGGYIWLTPDRLRLGRYLMHRHGGKVVFLGRFVALLRCLSGVLAGAGRLGWWHFCAVNFAGAVLWAGLYGFGAYALGKEIRRVAAPLGLGIGAVALLLTFGFILFMRRNEARLTEIARREIAD